MPTEEDIRKAEQRIRNGTDVISTIMRMKKEAREAREKGNMSTLSTAGYKIVSFNAPAV